MEGETYRGKFIAGKCIIAGEDQKKACSHMSMASGFCRSRQDIQPGMTELSDQQLICYGLSC